MASTSNTMNRIRSSLWNPVQQHISLQPSSFSFQRSLATSFSSNSTLTRSFSGSTKVLRDDVVTTVTGGSLPSTYTPGYIEDSRQKKQRKASGPSANLLNYTLARHNEIHRKAALPIDRKKEPHKLVKQPEKGETLLGPITSTSAIISKEDVISEPMLRRRNLLITERPIISKELLDNKEKLQLSDPISKMEKQLEAELEKLDGLEKNFEKELDKRRTFRGRTFAFFLFICFMSLEARKSLGDSHSSLHYFIHDALKSTLSVKSFWKWWSFLGKWDLFPTDFRSEPLQLRQELFIPIDDINSSNSYGVGHYSNNEKWKEEVKLPLKERIDRSFGVPLRRLEKKWEEMSQNRNDINNVNNKGNDNNSTNKGNDNKDNVLDIRELGMTPKLALMNKTMEQDMASKVDADLQLSSAKKAEREALRQLHAKNDANDTRGEDIARALANEKAATEGDAAIIGDKTSSSYIQGAGEREWGKTQPNSVFTMINPICISSGLDYQGTIARGLSKSGLGMCSLGPFFIISDEDAELRAVATKNLNSKIPIWEEGEPANSWSNAEDAVVSWSNVCDLTRHNPMYLTLEEFKKIPQFSDSKLKYDALRLKLCKVGVHIHADSKNLIEATTFAIENGADYIVLDFRASLRMSVLKKIAEMEKKVPFFVAIKGEDLEFWITYFIGDDSISKENFGFVVNDKKSLKILYLTLNHRKTEERKREKEYEKAIEAWEKANSGSSSKCCDGRSISKGSDNSGEKDTNQEDTTDILSIVKPPFSVYRCPIMYQLEDDVHGKDSTLSLEIQELIMEGASIVEVYSTIFEKGLIGILDLKTELAGLVATKNCYSLPQLIGSNHDPKRKKTEIKVKYGK